MLSDKQRRHLFAQFRTMGSFDREDRVQLASDILVKYGLDEITSFNDLDAESYETLIGAIQVWSLIQEVRLYTGNLTLDNDVARLANQYKEAREGEEDFNGC